jgi:hypothetical protein
MRANADLGLRQEPASFGATCLPLTMELARLARPVLLLEVVTTPDEWAYEDRVLVLLLPSLHREVERFRDLGGPEMKAIFEPHQLEHIDQTLVRSLLAMITDRSPEIGASIIRSAELPSDADESNAWESPVSERSEADRGPSGNVG